jgi:phosphate-selective porin OprO/OprP
VAGSEQQPATSLSVLESSVFAAAVDSYPGGRHPEAAGVSRLAFVANAQPRELDWALRARVVDLEARLGKLTEKPPADRPSIQVGGRIMADWALFGQSGAHRSAYGNIENGCEFRRARFFIRGDAFHVIDYKLEMDFADAAGTGVALPGTLQSTSFKDVYITVKELPVLGRVRIGHFKEPFSLEESTSSKYITFMERALGINAFSPSRNMGIMTFDHSAGERVTWAIGAFRTEMGDEPPIRRSDGGGTSLTMRATCLPWYDEGSGGRGLLHAGIAYSFRDVDDGTARFDSYPEADLAPDVVDTGVIDGVASWQLLGLEAAWVYGPLSVQTEYFGTYLRRPGRPRADFRGYYVFVSYFLTGENRVYDRASGIFRRVRPFENFFRVRTEQGISTGKGAWEVAYRHSCIDLTDAGIRGGRASNHTLGLNWYLNPYTRIMWNYVHSRARIGTAAESDLNVFEMRAQIDF